MIQSLTSREILDALAAPAPARRWSPRRSPPTISSAPRRCRCGWKGCRTTRPRLSDSSWTPRCEGYCEEYEAYLDAARRLSCRRACSRSIRAPGGHVPGLGAFCAGPDLREATIARDITEHTIAVKSLVAATGSLPGAAGRRAVPHGVPHAAAREARAAAGRRAPRRRHGRSAGQVALVTGAAGAIGTGICQGLLAAGCLVAATDLPGAPWTPWSRAWVRTFPGRCSGCPWT